MQKVTNRLPSISLVWLTRDTVMGDLAGIGKNKRMRSSCDNCRDLPRYSRNAITPATTSPRAPAIKIPRFIALSDASDHGTDSENRQWTPIHTNRMNLCTEFSNSRPFAVTSELPTG